MIFLSFAVALAFRFPFDLLLRIPAVAVAAFGIWRTGPVLLAFPKLLAFSAPLQLIISYMTLPAAFLVAFLYLTADFASDARRHPKRTAHAA